MSYLYIQDEGENAKIYNFIHSISYILSIGYHDTSKTVGFSYNFLFIPQSETT